MRPISSKASVLERARRTDAWGRYWARGLAHSCPGTYGSCYGGALGEFWQAVFSSLRGDERVLDIATGNGALPRLLLDASRKSGVVCDAVDIAPVDPAWLRDIPEAQRRRLRFYGGIDACQMPFGGASFDLVVSHYGLEYADLELAVAEMLRVLKPAGSIALVLHHAEGRPASLAAIEIAHLEWLAKANGILDVAEALIEPFSRSATEAGRHQLRADSKANACRERFNALQAELASRSTREGADVLTEARSAIAAVLATAASKGAAMGAAALQGLRDEFRASEVRLRDLCAHALDPSRAEALASWLRHRAGADPKLLELRDQGYLMGWQLTVRQAPR